MTFLLSAWRKSTVKFILNSALNPDTTHNLLPLYVQYYEPELLYYQTHFAVSRKCLLCIHYNPCSIQSGGISTMSSSAELENFHK